MLHKGNISNFKLFFPCFLSAVSNKEAVKTKKEMYVREERCPNRKD